MEQFELGNIITDQLANLKKYFTVRRENSISSAKQCLIRIFKIKEMAVYLGWLIQGVIAYMFRKFYPTLRNLSGHVRHVRLCDASSLNNNLNVRNFGMRNSQTTRQRFGVDYYPS
jgi:hypothetical protein